MSDWGATLRELVEHLGSHDPRRLRFGARHHDYRLGAPLAPGRLAELEAELDVRFPDDYRRHVEAADGGAGPYHGLMPLDHPVQRACARGEFDPADPYHGVVGLAHVGCGYVALLVVRGRHAGEVWVDARVTDDGVAPLHDSFHAFFAEWALRMAHQEWPRRVGTPGRCALPQALSDYLLRKPEADLASLDDGGITTWSTADTPFFARGDLLDLCPTCAAMVENLAPRGMRWAQVKPGVSPIPMRDRWP